MSGVTTATWLGSLAMARALPIAASAVVHGAVFVSLYSGAVRAHAPSVAAESLLVLETIDAPADMPAPPPQEEAAVAPQPAPATEPHASARPTHTHPYPVPAAHDATPHDPSIDHHHDGDQEPAPAAPAVVAAPALPSDPPRFTIKLGSSASPARRVGSGNGSGAGALPGEASGAPAPEVFAEAAVSTPARLVASAAPQYPAVARSSEIEAEVPFEIVVDVTGAVVDARPLRRVGYGFDEAAASALRRYRFSPAQRDGRLVRVRMRWSVQFRLR